MEQRSKEWFNARKGKLTGSNIGAALDVNPWKTPYDLIRQMVREYHGVESEFVGNIATEYGTLHEPLAIMDYEMKSGNSVEDCGFIVHPKYDWIGASPDGLIGESGVLEVKCPFGQRNKNPPEFKLAKDQPHYYAQMQIEMACTGREYCDFYQWSKYGDSLEVVEFDKAWFDDSVVILKEFYDRYLSEIDNKEHLEDKIKEVNTLLADELIKEHDKLKATIGDADARIKEIVKELVTICKERDSIVCGRKLTNVERKGNVDYKKVPELKGVDLDPYRKKSSKYWKFS